MATINYPNQIDSFTTKIDNVNDVMADDVNTVQNGIVAIESTLGENPQGSYNSVNERITIESIINAMIFGG